MHMHHAVLRCISTGSSWVPSLEHLTCAAEANSQGTRSTSSFMLLDSTVKSMVWKHCAPLDPVTDRHLSLLLMCRWDVVRHGTWCWLVHWIISGKVPWSRDCCWEWWMLFSPHIHHSECVSDFNGFFDHCCHHTELGSICGCFNGIFLFAYPEDRWLAKKNKDPSDWTPCDLVMSMVWINKDHCWYFINHCCQQICPISSLSSGYSSRSSLNFEWSMASSGPWKIGALKLMTYHLLFFLLKYPNTRRSHSKMPFTRTWMQSKQVKSLQIPHQNTQSWQSSATYQGASAISSAC